MSRHRLDTVIRAKEEESDAVCRHRTARDRLEAEVGRELLKYFPELESYQDIDGGREYAVDDVDKFLEYVSHEFHNRRWRTMAEEDRVYLRTDFMQKERTRFLGCGWDYSKKVCFTSIENPKLPVILAEFDVNKDMTDEKLLKRLLGIVPDYNKGMGATAGLFKKSRRVRQVEDLSDIDAEE